MAGAIIGRIAVGALALTRVAHRHAAARPPHDRHHPADDGSADMVHTAR